ncbi:hypothetical protein V5O48_013795 [Marasmius crinis-equi]|uniref:Uncharacterized protein n=1 Tax=Marasmius crinis-equi TaxID=585013 RepID=A0ABR3EZF7_9AGAR
MRRETDGPVPDPVVSDAEVEAARAAERLPITARPPSPSTYFAAGANPVESDLFSVEGPLNTTGGVYWTSVSRQPMTCPPPKSSIYPFAPGAIWINELRRPNEEPVRQVFVCLNGQGDWVVVPGDSIEEGKAGFAHPTETDRWFVMPPGKKPSWLKAATIEKNQRGTKRGNLDVLAEAAVNAKRTRFNLDPNASATTNNRRVGRASSTPHPRASTPRLIRPSLAAGPPRAATTNHTIMAVPGEPAQAPE